MGSISSPHEWKKKKSEEMAEFDPLSETNNYKND